MHPFLAITFRCIAFAPILLRADDPTSDGAHFVVETLAGRMIPTKQPENSMSFAPSCCHSGKKCSARVKRACSYRRLGSASTSVSTACLAAGASSCSLSAVFMAQELSCETSLFMRSLTPNKSFGEISMTRHRSGMRVEATAFVPFSYF